MDESSEPRFAFGENWARFARGITLAQCVAARESLGRWFPSGSLAGKTFADVGCGSGLFSLAAAVSGADVMSFDYDAKSVETCRVLRDVFFPASPRWRTAQGSVLDRVFLEKLGRYDIVYSWGVLHHTGSMWEAVRNAARMVKPGGALMVALYNDQGAKSRFWLRVKCLYNRLPRVLRPAYVVLFAGVFESRVALLRLLRGKNPLPWSEWKKNTGVRGMSVWHDWVDWYGGLPFEVARPDEVVAFLAKEGFSLVREQRASSLGCNEFLFERHAGSTASADRRDA